MTVHHDAGRPAGRDDRPQVRTTEVLPGVWRLCLPMLHHGVLNVNAWALRRDDGLLLVDAGMPGPEALEDALAQLGAGWADVREIVCTHAHLDHAGGLAAAREASGADAWLHPNAFAPAGVVPPTRASLDRSGMPVDLAAAVGLVDSGGDVVDVAALARPLPSDASFVTEHGSWRPILTPGHDHAHVCLFAERSGLLISGDQLLAPRQVVLDASLGAAAIPTMLASLDALIGLDASTALPGHGPAVRDIPAAVERIRAALAARLERTTAVLAAAVAPVTAYELLLAVNDAREPLSVDQARWWLPALECELAQLRAEGHADELIGEDGVARWR